MNHLQWQQVYGTSGRDSYITDYVNKKARDNIIVQELTEGMVLYFGFSPLEFHLNIYHLSIFVSWDMNER